MRYFDFWFNRVSHEIANAIQNESVQELRNHPALQKKLYKQVHLHGVGNLEPVLELSGSLLRDIPHVPTTFNESDWVVQEAIGKDLLLKRGKVVIKAPRKHGSLTYDPDSKIASIKRQRYFPAVMPDWDRIISAFGWPDLGDSRIYLPTVRDPKSVAKIVEALDSTKFRWHMKTTRREKVIRPDAVVLYVDETDTEDVVNHIQSVVPTTGEKIPGFSIPLNSVGTIGVGAVRPQSQHASYGWSFASEIAKNLKDLTNHSSTVEEKAKLSLDWLINSSRRGQVDVKLPW